VLPLAAPVHFRKGMRDKDEDKKRLVCIIYRSIDDYVLHYSNHSVFHGNGLFPLYPGMDWQKVKRYL